MKKILIITPRSPFEGRGADEQDRLAGIEWWINKGWEVTVITKIYPSDLQGVEEARKKYNICIHAVPYRYAGEKTILTILKRILIPKYWDGAAYEYFDPEIQKLASLEAANKPDLVWVDYTYLWPLYPHFQSKGIPVITRSINFEPTHFLDEDGRKLSNYIKFLPKYLSELKALWMSSYFFSITPKEEASYRRLGRTPVATLPLRALPKMIGKKRLSKNDSLIHIGFMASTYNVQHNIKALLFIVNDIFPALPLEIRNKIKVHITGNKLPKDISDAFPAEIVYEGFVPSSVEFWLSMDIALVPSIFGAGMQQKIFEPLTLGMPTITSRRGIAEYPFICGVHLLCAETKEEVKKAIIKLVEDPTLREEVSKVAQTLSEELFNEMRYDELIEEALATI